MSQSPSLEQRKRAMHDTAKAIRQHEIEKGRQPNHRAIEKEVQKIAEDTDKRRGW